MNSVVSARPAAESAESGGGRGITLTAGELIALQARCRAFWLPARQPSRSALAGPHQSRFRGRGVDYLESRYYVPGDDIRNMDWRVTARTGKPHTKVFQEERERPVMVVVDRNPSMFFGTRRRLKSVQAAHIAAAAGWMAITRGDRIGGVVFGGGVHHEIKPAGGRRGAMRLIQQLVRWCNPDRQDGGTDAFSDTLQRLRNVVRPGSLVILISDFFALDEDCSRHLSRLVQHNDIVGCQVIDPAERFLPDGQFPISDGEQQAVLNTRNRRQKDRFASVALAHQEEPKKMFQRYGARWLPVATDESGVDRLGMELRRSRAFG